MTTGLRDSAWRDRDDRPVDDNRPRENSWSGEDSWPEGTDRWSRRSPWDEPARSEPPRWGERWGDQAERAPTPGLGDDPYPRDPYLADEPGPVGRSTADVAAVSTEQFPAVARAVAVEDREAAAPDEASHADRRGRAGERVPLDEALDVDRRRRLGAKGRGWSHLGLRVFAVLLLVAGVGVGIATGVVREGDPDTVEVTDQADGSGDGSVPTPGTDTRRSQGLQVGRDLLDHAKQKAALDAARRSAQQKAAAAAQDSEARADKAAESRASRTREAGGPSGEEPPSAPVDCQTYSGNRRTGCSLLSWAGFETTQMNCLDKLWTRESQWRETAENPSSGAYGIPQALPGDKMASYGSDWRTNPVPQIKWGLNYIKGRYGTPCDAWAHSQSVGWY